MHNGIRQTVSDFVEKNDLYRQGGSGCLFFTATAFDRCLEIIPGVSIGYYGHDELDFAYRKEHLVTLSQRILDAVVDRDSAITQLWQQWRVQQQVHEDYVAHLDVGNLTHLSKQMLNQELTAYQQVVYTIWNQAFLIDCFDPSGHEQLEQMVFSHHPTLTDAEKQIVVQHNIPTTQMLCERAILHGVIHHDPHLAATVQRQYHWMANDYMHASELPIAHFAEMIDSCMRMYPTHGAQQARLHAIDSWSASVHAQKEQVYRLHGLSKKEQGIVEVFAHLTDWREERKRATQKGSVIFQAFVDAIARMYSLEPELVRCHDPRDVELLNSSSVREVLEHRRRYGVLQVFTADTRQSTFIEDPEAIALFRHAGSVDVRVQSAEGRQQFSGQIGMKGKVTGVVKIIMGVKDFEKFLPGDILVSPMTRPELMPVIRKASGMITDEGGITCHAALIARELKIPCIIGTQCATRMLKDGDRVTLDATSGNVSIL